MSTEYVWVIVHEGSMEGKVMGSVFPIVRPPMVALLRKAVKAEMPNLLAHCDAVQLQVYPPNPTEAKTEPYRASEEDFDDGTTEERPLVVVAPPPPDTSTAHSDSKLDELTRGMNELLADKKSTPFSGITCERTNKVLQGLSLRCEGATWETRKYVDEPIPPFTWDVKQKEDSDDNRKGYLQYLKSHCPIDDDYTWFDAKPVTRLLETDLYNGQGHLVMTVRGTTDVVLVESRHADATNDDVRNNIDLQIELKQEASMSKDYNACVRQARAEHVAASYVSPTKRVVTLLTDLGKRWHFFWFSSRHRNMLNIKTKRQEAVYLIRNIFREDDGRVASQFPTGFLSRSSWSALPRARLSTVNEFASSRPPDNDEQDATGRGGGFGERQGGGTSQSKSKRSHNKRRDGGGSHAGMGGSSMQNSQHATLGESRFDELRLYARSDIANELDFIDSVDPDEEMEVLRSFIARHVLHGVVVPSG